MKILKVILLSAVVLASALTVNAQTTGEKNVVFNVTVDAASKAKVEKSMPSEKGVKKVAVDMKAQTVTITYQEAQSNVVNLQKAIEKSGVTVKGTKAPAKESVDKKGKKKKKSKKGKGAEESTGGKKKKGGKKK